MHFALLHINYTPRDVTEMLNLHPNVSLIPSANKLMVIDLSLFFAIVHENWSLQEWRRGKRENWNVNVKLHFAIIYIHLLRWRSPVYISSSIYWSQPLLPLNLLTCCYKQWIMNEKTDQGTAYLWVDLYATLLCRSHVYLFT